MGQGGELFCILKVAKHLMLHNLNLAGKEGRRRW
jgi:hypothetical protein